MLSKLFKAAAVADGRIGERIGDVRFIAYATLVAGAVYSYPMIKDYTFQESKGQVSLLPLAERADVNAIIEGMNASRLNHDPKKRMPAPAFDYTA